MKLRILLLQARNADDPVRQEERQSFADKTGLDLEQIVPHDLLGGPPAMRQVRHFDAVMVGGSGDYYVSKRSLPQFDAQLEILAEIAARGLPMFASCFGFQILVQALGGSIVHDPDNVEVGTYDLSLTAEGRQDPLLGLLPDTFAAQLGRKDRAERLPDGVTHLVSSERSPYQAFRIPDKPIWATQFHPELDLESNKLRFERYLKGYAAHMTEADREAARRRFTVSPETDKLLPGFLELVFG
jgi:GMP synthase (glutamine-hydrolysing)